LLDLQLVRSSEIFLSLLQIAMATVSTDGQLSFIYFTTGKSKYFHQATKYSCMWWTS